MLRTLRADKRQEEGFTLIELLVVVIIIGILAAIAIPVFLNQREKARNASANSDLRNLITAEEGNFTEADAYTTDKAGDLADNGLTRSSGVGLCIGLYAKGSNTEGSGSEVFHAMSYHQDGTLYYYYDSSVGKIEKGGSVEDSTTPAAGAETANCDVAP